MTTFEDREKGFERKFAHDEELKFKATARRNKLIGLWAAEKMGLTGDEAQAYAREVIKADLAEPGDEDVFRKVRSDFDAKGVDQSDHQIRRMIGEHDGGGGAPDRNRSQSLKLAHARRPLPQGRERRAHAAQRMAYPQLALSYSS